MSWSYNITISILLWSTSGPIWGPKYPLSLSGVPTSVRTLPGLFTYRLHPNLPSTRTLTVCTPTEKSVNVKTNVVYITKI